VKRGNSFTSHLMSVRPSKKRRRARRPSVMAEGMARNMRKLIGVYKSPGKIATAKALREKAKAAAAAAPAAA